MSEKMSTKEIVKNYEKLAEENKKDAVSGKAWKKAVNQTVRVLAAVLPPVLLTTFGAACEKPPVVEEQPQEEEKGQETIPSETEETTPQTNQESTPPVVEETSEKIEWEGATFSPIEGLRFDKGHFYFLEGNDYGGEVGTEAGVCITDGPEINGQTTWFGFKKEVIEVWQKKIMEEEKKFAYAFPMDLKLAKELAKGIEIKEVAFTQADDYRKSNGTFWDNNTSLVVSNVPLGRKIYAPTTTSDYLIWDNNCGRNDPSEPSWYTLFFRIPPEVVKEGLLFKGEGVDAAVLVIGAKGINLLPSGTEKNIAENEDEGYCFSTETKMGESIAEVASDTQSISMSLYIYQLKDKNSKVELERLQLLDVSKALKFGLAGLLEIENIPTYFSP